MKKMAIEFLFFSYFNIDIANVNEKQNDLLEAAIKRAYRDAASHVLKFVFDESYNLTDGMKEIIKKAYKTEGTKEILKHLNGEIDIGIDSKWIKELAEKLKMLYNMDGDELIRNMCDSNKISLPKYEKNIEFTLGMAQKWINMTVKNIHIMDATIKLYLESERSCLSDICEKFHDERIDVPIDDYIIKASCNELEIDVPSKDKNSKHKYSGKGTTKYSEKLAWSNWEPIDNNGENYYTVFQDKLKKNNKFKELGDGLLERENRLWINAATGKYDKKA